MPLNQQCHRLLHVAAVFVALSCADSPTAPSPDGSAAALSIQASLSSTTVNTMVVEVSGPGIESLLAFNIEIRNGVATGAVKVPAGSDRVVTLRAFDSRGIETHRGSAVINVRAGSNATMSIVLIPLTGQQPIQASIGSIVITIAAARDTLNVGDTVRLSATVAASTGDTVGRVVSWASLNPGRATVDTSGLVTARSAGPVDLVATYAGVGASKRLVIRGDTTATGGSGPISDTTSFNGVRLTLMSPSATNDFLAILEGPGVPAQQKRVSGTGITSGTVTFQVPAGQYTVRAIALDPRYSTLTGNGIISAGGRTLITVGSSGQTSASLTLVAPTYSITSSPDTATTGTYFNVAGTFTDPTQSVGSMSGNLSYSTFAEYSDLGPGATGSGSVFVSPIGGNSYSFSTSGMGGLGVLAPSTAGRIYYQIRVSTSFNLSTTGMLGGQAYYVFPSTTRGETLKQVEVQAP